MRKLSLTFVLSVGLTLIVLTACSGTSTVVVVVTSTPDPRIMQVTVTPSQNTATSQQAAPATATKLSSPTNTALNATATPMPTNTTGPTQTPNNFPTETKAELYIAQEDFEHGYMFWISTTKVIWVLFSSPSNPNQGEWQSYPDTWVDGSDPQNDPSLVAPTGLYAPVRGFLKLWSKTPGMRDALGWGKTPEFDLRTTYVYQPGGSLDANGNYIPGPGKHFITALSRDVYAMTEPQPGQVRGTWEKVS